MRAGHRRGLQVTDTRPFAIVLSVSLLNSYWKIFPFKSMLEHFPVLVHVGTFNSDELLGVKRSVTSSLSVMAEIAVASTLKRLATIG